MMNLLSISSQGGWTVALVGYAIVFAALVLLVVVFILIPKLFKLKLGAKIKSTVKTSQKTANVDLNADVAVAIALALNLHLSQQHDDESNVITIKRVTKNYSPWSSKIYGVMNQPNRNF